MGGGGVRVIDETVPPLSFNARKRWRIRYLQRRLSSSWTPSS